MTNYNWTLPISDLSENGIISDILSEGFVINGITILSDLKGDKHGLTSYLKEQATYLEQFLNVVISCNSHKNNVNDFVNIVPNNIIMSLSYIWRSLNKEAKELLIKRFDSQNGFLLATFTEKEQIFNFYGISNYDYGYYRDSLVSVIVDTLKLYCECFQDCIYFARYFNSIIPKRSIENKDDDKRRRNRLKEKELHANKVQTIEESFSDLKSKLSTRSKNVLVNNGIGKLEEFLSLVDLKPAFNFLDLSNCGKKSAMELDSFKSKVLQLASMKSSSPAPSKPIELPDNKEKTINYLAKSLNNIHSSVAKSWVIDNYGTCEKFAIDFTSSPQSLFNRFSYQINPSAYKLCMLFCEFFARTALLSEDIKTGKDIQALLKIFVQQVNNNRQILLARMLLTDNKKTILSIEFNKATKSLSTRARNVISDIVDESDCDNIVTFITKRYDFILLEKIGIRSTLELSHFQYGLRKLFTQIIFSEENIVEYHSIHEKYPFLEDKDIRFVTSFYSEEGHFPMFFLAERFFINKKLPRIQMYKDYYGIGKELPLSLDDIAAKYNYTRERVRQIISSLYKRISKDTSLFTKDNWKDYSFIFDNIVTTESSNFQKIVDTEDVELTFPAFCGIVKLVDFKIISTFRTDDNELCIAYSPLIKGFSLANAIKEIKRLSSVNKDVDISISLNDFVANNEIYWPKWWSKGTAPENDQIDLAYKVLLEIVKGLRIGEVDDKGNVVFRANKLNYAEVIYNIIKSNGSPMHIDEVCKEFSRLYPNDSRNNVATIRTYILKDDRLESIGRTSTYKLKAWEGFSGSIPTLLVRLTTIKNKPIKATKLAEEALRYRSDSTLRSITSNINQKVNDGTLCMFYPDLVGLGGKNYGRKYKMLPRTFDDFLKAFVDFVDENKRYPYSSSHGYEGMLNHWYNKAKKLISLSDSEIIAFSKAMKELESFHYPHNSTEADFQSICLTYKSFVSSAHHLVSDEDDEHMFSWFVKSAKSYMSWDDNRKYYFQDLLDFISHKL